MSSDSILVAGARENNLKDVTLRIPKNRIVVFTGVSGSGKSSIVFDTVAVEAQRQLNETFTWFIRSRLPKYEKPEADVIDNLSAAVVVDQKPLGGNSRSTVGTMTDIYSVIRVLFSRCGVPAAATSSVFSFNDPEGMCPECDGLGRIVRLDLDRFLDRTRSLNEGPIRFPQFGVGSLQWQMYANSGAFDLDKPLADYSDEEWHHLLHGTGRTEMSAKSGTFNLDYEGLVDRFSRLYLKRDIGSLADKTRDSVLAVVSEVVCPLCAGARLNQTALAGRINGRNIADHSAMEVADLVEVLAAIDDPVGAPIAAAAIERLRRVIGIGLGYLSLGRETSTLSGGEGQRLKTVRYLGSALAGMTYIFDEPSVGLHPRDVHRLNELLVQLRDKGNTVLVVEHDPDVIAIADHVIDIGPGAGAHGGEVVFQGDVESLRRADTVTGRALRTVTPVKTDVRAPTGWLPLENASLHNLKNVSVDLPTGVLTAVTGVAGSGKSTLISDVFVGAHPEAIVVDQSAIGVSSRSTPASYVGVLDHLRKLFSQENGGKAAGVEPGLFSFNSRGACPACEGRGVIYTDLAFMDPITTTCEKCEGRRFAEEVLTYTVRGKSIVDVLDMTAEQALDFFPEKRVHAKLATLNEVGLDYLTLGQPLSTLSGGERQRIKLANELHKTGSVYVLDEPTTGLHMADVGALVALLDRLVDAGNTVIVIEHNLDVIKRADRIIDLGPDGGKHGGEIVFTGTPADLLEDHRSLTAEHVRRSLA
ncbi:ATP-binding cassette domain-containing protein [Thermomonospora umbrina]|nr:excinuclease ABC subunit UvrA [Thermomonospora umbrina]